MTNYKNKRSSKKNYKNKRVKWCLPLRFGRASYSLPPTKKKTLDFYIVIWRFFSFEPSYWILLVQSRQYDKG